MPIPFKEIYEEEKEKLKEEFTRVLSLYHPDYRQCGLAIVNFTSPSFGDDVYLKQILKDARDYNINVRLENIGSEYFDGYVCADFLRLINELNNSKRIDGIIILNYNMLSQGFLGENDCIINSVKDIDAFNLCDNNRNHKGATILSVFECLKLMGVNHQQEYNDNFLSGKTVLVIGRSQHIGMALVNSFIEAHCTVINANSLTPHKELIDYILKSDIIISTAGKPGFIKAPDFMDNEDILKDKYFVDVGIGSDSEGRAMGDINPNLYPFLSPEKYTPVPGSVGLFTRLNLFRNLNNAYENHAIFGF